MGIMNGKIVASMPDQTEALHQLIKEMVDEDSEILTLITGEDATEEETKSLVQYIEETYPSVEVEVHLGNQPIYPYIISVE